MKKRRVRPVARHVRPGQVLVELDLPQVLADDVLRHEPVHRVHEDEAVAPGRVAPAVVLGARVRVRIAVVHLPRRAKSAMVARSCTTSVCLAVGGTSRLECYDSVPSIVKRI